MRNFIINGICLLAFLGVLAPDARAEVKLPPCISDHMVFQRDKDVVIWGTASPGEKLSVIFDGRTEKDTAREDGTWRVNFGKVDVSENSREISIYSSFVGAVPYVVSDVHVGDVWLCTGQANMTWTVQRSANPEKEKAGADKPLIRVFTVKNKPSDTPASTADGTWQACSPESVPQFSAASYCFADELQPHAKVPIGIIIAAQLGAPLDAWLPPDALNEMRGKVRAAADGKGAAPGAVFNGMLAPLTRLPVKGFVWHGGEADVPRAPDSPRSGYQTDLLIALAKSWRKAWGDGSLPFLAVQLANYQPDPEPGANTGRVNSDVMPPSRWPWSREAQALAFKDMSHSALVVTIDIGDARDITYRNQRETGRRLALAARSIAYGERVVCQAPIFKGHSRNKYASVVEFDGVVNLREGEEVKGFAVAGEDRIFYWANARVLPSLREVKVELPGALSRENPKWRLKEVRYAWTDNPNANLVGEDKLPVAPFRSDEWLGVE